MLTSVWTIPGRCVRRMQTYWKTSTTPSYVILSKMMLSIMKTPVLPTPSLKKKCVKSVYVKLKLHIDIVKTNWGNLYFTKVFQRYKNIGNHWIFISWLCQRVRSNGTWKAKINLAFFGCWLAKKRMYKLQNLFCKID